MKRRDFVKTPFALSPFLATPQPLAQGAKLPTPTRAQPAGTTNWQLTNIKANAGKDNRSAVIEGYCRQQSLEAGQKLDICVSTNPPRRFTIDIFRMGYYGGAGGRHFHTIGPLNGQPQPDPPVGHLRLRECKWEPSVSFTIPAEWPSGVYLGKLTCIPEAKTEHAWQSYVVFIVRDRRRADILFQVSDNTWSAYNRWPDNYSLYTDPRHVWAFDVAVGFDRPYAKDPYVWKNPLSIGSGEFLIWEFPLAYWLEQQGYDVTYVSNSDMIDASHLARVKVFLSVGHDEYWDLRQYENALASIQKGITHLYLSGNAVMGVTPFSPSSDGRPNRVITRVGMYGGAYGEFGEFFKDPRFGSAGREPPVSGPPANRLIGAHSMYPPDGGGDWICTKLGHWIFDGTGMKKGDRIPGLVGFEFHGDPADIPGLEIVAEGDALNEGRRPVHWTATLYPGPRKNFVFNAATIWWAQGLAAPPGHILPWYHGVRPHGPDERVQRITRNLLSRALS
jgi:hypothetical protein